MEVKKYLTAPQQVEAVFVEKIWFPNIAIWCGGKVSQYWLKEELVDCIEFHSFSGIQITKEGDYIIKDGAGLFSVDTDEHFKYNYTEL